MTSVEKGTSAVLTPAVFSTLQRFLSFSTKGSKRREDLSVEI